MVFLNIIIWKGVSCDLGINFVIIHCYLYFLIRETESKHVNKISEKKIGKYKGFGNSWKVLK